MNNMLVASVFAAFHLPMAVDSLDCVIVKAHYKWLGVHSNENEANQHGRHIQLCVIVNTKYQIMFLNIM